MSMAIPMRRLLLVAVAVFFVVLCVLHVAHADSPSLEHPPAQALTTTDSGVVDASGSGPAIDAASTAKATVFVPTKEWQEVPKDVHIPAGLDVRLNLATGKRFAKLIEGSDGDRVGIQAQARQAMAEAVSTLGDTADAQSRETASTKPDDSGLEPTSGATASERMKDILLSLPEPEQGLTSAIASGVSGEELDAIVKRVWEDRQKLLREVMAKAKTEGQQMQGALGRIVAEAGDAERVRESLLDLEFHVSSAHNAEDFRNGGGFAVLSPLLNHTHSGVRAAAAWALGSAVKYSPKSQRVAAMSGAAEALTGILSDAASFAHRIETTCAPLEGGAGSCAREVLEPAARASYALGALVRSAPADVIHAAVAANTHGQAAAAARSLSVAALAQADPEVAGSLRAVAIKCLGVAGDLHSAASAAARGQALPESSADAKHKQPQGVMDTANASAPTEAEEAEVLASGAQLHGATTTTASSSASSSSASSSSSSSSASADDHDQVMAAAAVQLAQGSRDTIAAGFRSGETCSAALYTLAAAAGEPHEGARHDMMRRAVRAVAELPVSCRAGMSKASAMPRTDRTQALLKSVQQALEAHRLALHEQAKAALGSDPGKILEDKLADVPDEAWAADGSGVGTEAADLRSQEALRQYEQAAAAADAADAMGVVDGVLKQVRAGLVSVASDMRR